MGKYLNGYGDSDDNGVFRCTGRFGCSAREHTANGRHPTDRLAVKATRLVEAHRGAGRPFFLTLADKVPHRESQPADRHAHSHDGARAPRGASFNENDTADKPGYVARDAKLAAKGVRPPGCPPEDYPIAYPTTHSELHELRGLQRPCVGERARRARDLRRPLRRPGHIAQAER